MRLRRWGIREVLALRIDRRDDEGRWLEPWRTHEGDGNRVKLRLRCSGFIELRWILGHRLLHES